MATDSPSFDSGTTTPTSATGWIAKRDRHMQLINSNIYEQEVQARAKAIEETRLMKAQQREDRELAKVNKYFENTRPNTPNTPGPHTGASKPQEYQIMVEDIPFRVVKGGSKLARVSSEIYIATRSAIGISLRGADDPMLAKNTPKRAVIGGVKFVRSRNGNLHRLGAVKSKRWVLGE
jgi:hypothetical protein